MADSMIERLARVASEAMGYDYDVQDTSKADPNTPMTDDLKEGVRAVLQAMREPSEAMTEAGDSCLGIAASPVIWQAMIDAALAETPDA